MIPTLYILFNDYLCIPEGSQQPQASTSAAAAATSRGGKRKINRVPIVFDLQSESGSSPAPGPSNPQPGRPAGPPARGALRGGPPLGRGGPAGAARGVAKAKRSTEQGSSAVALLSVAATTVSFCYNRPRGWEE